MNELKIDAEFRDLISPLSDEEFKGLEENILRYGVRVPLDVWQGTLIDGHNRYEIAKRHNLPFKTAEMHFDSRDDVICWIIDNQLDRRNLTPALRIKLALRKEPIIAKQAKEHSLANLKQNTELDICPTRITPNTSQKKDDLPKQNWRAKRKTSTNNQVAQIAQVSDKTVQRYKKIQEKASDKVKAKVDSGEISINEGYNQVKRAEKETKQEERRERKSYTPSTELPTEDFKLICADIRDGLPDIEDSSVDFIITDPPYPKEYLPLYADLSKLAARVLKDGGSLVCMTGQSYLPEVIQLLKANMTYHWCMCYLTPGQKTQLWQRHLHTAWKPLLWFVKGEYKGDWLGDDVMTSPGKDKDFHEWGQSLGGMKDIVERLTNPNDVILDPFLGGGTTGIIAVSCKRKFIGVDVEQSCIDTTLNRIKESFNG